jgi:hypothetical protein
MATAFAALLLAGLVYNWLRQPTLAILRALDAREYGVSVAAQP